MKTDGNWWTAVLSAGITAGYATTVVQLSPGPGYVFSALRRKLTVKTENLPSSLPTWAKDYVDSLGNLAYCGWCLSRGFRSGVGDVSQDKPGTVRSQVGGRVDRSLWRGRVPPPLR
jgi:hypothetical protein